MSEEKKVETKVEEVKEEKVEQPKEQLFNQEQVNNIIKSRLESEKAKYQRQLDEQKRAEEEVVKQKQIADAKTKADLEKLMQQRIAEKEAEIQKFKAEIKKEKIDNSLLSVASKNNAINPQQVVDLVKNQIRLSDDNRIEVLDNNNNIRYNQAGELLTIEEKVQEFLKANPHLSLSGKSGVGSQSSVEGKTVKPFNIQDLDMSKPEDRKRYAEYRKERDSRPTQINLTNK